MHPAFHMHRSSTLPQRHQKPLSTSALGIPHASFLSLPQRHQKPLSASALGIPHASFFSAPAASSIVTFRKCTWHPACIVLLGSSSIIKNNFRKCHPHSALLFFYASAASSKATFCKCTWHPACLILGSSSLIEKPLSASAPCIPHALFSLQQHHQKPLSTSALGMPHASFFSAPAASSKPLSASALRIQYALFAPVASHQNNHFLQVNTESRMHRSSTLPQCHVKSHFP